MPLSIFGCKQHEEALVLLGQGSANTDPVAIPISGQAASIIKIEVDKRTSGFAASSSRPFTIAVGRQTGANAFLPLSSLTSIDPSTIS